MEAQTKPEDIVRTQYKTSSVNRLTTNDEFNKDAELMWEEKERYLKINDRLRGMGIGKNERRLKLSEVVFASAKELSEKIKRKNWGVWEGIRNKTPEIGELVWVRKFGINAGRPVKGVWDGERFVDAEGNELSGTEWSLIYE